MSIPQTIKSIISDKGVTQTWVVEKMNRINPSLIMNCTKFSAIVCGVRKMSGDELLAFCQAMGTNPDVFLDEAS